VEKYSTMMSVGVMKFQYVAVKPFYHSEENPFNLMPSVNGMC
jgi:hypothetical protein